MISKRQVQLRITRVRIVFLVITFLVLYTINPLTAQPAPLPGDQIRALAWSPDGQQVAVGYQDGRIEVIPLDSPSNVRVLQEGSQTGQVIALSWSPDGQMLASGTGNYDNQLTIWDVNKGIPTLTDDTFGVDILAIAWSPDGKHILATSAEPRSLPFNSVFVNMLTNEIQGLSLGTVSSIHWNSDGTRIALSHIGNLFIFDVASMSIVSEYPIDRTRFRSNLQNQAVEVIWSHDGTQIAVGMGDGRILILSHENPDTLTPVTTLIAHEYNGDDRLLGFVYDLSFTSDDSQLTGISGDGTIRTWKTSTWQMVQETRTVPNYGAAFSPYGGRAVVGAVSDTSGMPLESTTNAAVISTIGNGRMHIIVPAPTLERLNAIAEMCVRDAPTLSRAMTGLTSEPVVSLDALPDFIAQVESLPAETIPAACRADLLAVAEVLQAKP